ncbi:MAG: S8 family serine peptidase, partial [Acidobacteriota bacterium]|nr:S8 family serine peptidase [Acidobacteriota bacterium]
MWKSSSRDGALVIGVMVLLLTLMAAPPADACWTPLEWQTKPVEWDRDRDGNGIDDTLDAKIGSDQAAPPATREKVVVNLTRCPTATDISWLSQYGTILKRGRYVTFVAMGDVDPADLPTLAAHPVVAMIEEMHGFQSALNVSGAAIKVRSSTNYPMNLEDLAPLVDGTGTTIAIIDSGVDDQAGSGTTHEMFPSSKYVGGYIVGSGLGNPDDTDSHGTHVAGIATGILSSGAAGHRGMAPAAGLVDCQTTLMCGPNSWLDVIECFEQLITNQPTWQVDVVNLSLRQCDTSFQTITTDGTDAASQMANQVVARGISVVAAAGNDGPGNSGLTSPCSADNAVCVAAMDDQNTVTRSDDAIANFSSRGPRAPAGDL